LKWAIFSFVFFNFCLWQQLGNLNQKIAHVGEDLDFYSEMVSLYDKARTYFEEKC